MVVVSELVEDVTGQLLESSGVVQEVLEFVRKVDTLVVVVVAPGDSELVSALVIKMAAPSVVSGLVPEADHMVQWYQS